MSLDAIVLSLINRSTNYLGQIQQSLSQEESNSQEVISLLEQIQAQQANMLDYQEQTLGTNDFGDILGPKYDNNGHLEVSLHDPLLPFGSLHTESLEPIFQADAVYGINPIEVLETVGHLTNGVSSATNTGTGGLFKSSTGTTALSFATIQSRRRLRYRPGQGVLDRFTMMFSAPAANSITVIGCGTGESGFYFGYNGTTFGILHSTGGVREIQTLTITVGSSTNQSMTVTLAGVAFTVAVTNSGSTLKTAYEISRGTYTGWKAEQRGSTVIFLADSVGNKAGTFSITAATAVGTFAETVAGVASDDDWIPQTEWNQNKLLGEGPTGVTLNPQKLNVGQIKIQYLGAGAVTFQIEVCPEGNNPIFVDVHTIAFPNQLEVPSVSQPSFPFTMAAYSAGSTTNVWVASASFAGFIEGKKKLTGPLLTFESATNNFVNSVADTYYPLFTIRNDYVHRHGSVTPRANQSVINLCSLHAAHDDATPVTFYLIRNATLTGIPNFQQYSTVSCAYVDRAAATCTISTPEQILKSFPLAQNGSDGIDLIHEDITIQPGETVTLAARAVTGTATYVNASLNTRDDQ